MRLKKRKLWSTLKKEKQKGEKWLNKTNFKKKEKEKKKKKRTRRKCGVD